MYNKVLTAILVILIIAILIALGYLGYGYYKKYTLNKDAQEFIEEFDTIVVQLADEEPEEQTGQNTQTTNNSGMGGISTNQLYYKGFKVIGKLEMPTINIQYPILDDATHANAIEVSVVKIYGPGINEPGNVVIAGHNYNNGLFFGKNKKLQIGDKIYLTDLNGNRLQYTIYNKYYTPESDTSYITRTTDGKKEVTLYTCDATGKNRLIICARADE